MDKIWTFIFLSVSMQVYLQHSKQKRVQLIFCAYKLFITTLSDGQFMTPSATPQISLPRQTWWNKYEVLKKMSLGLRERKRISRKISKSMILNFVTSYLYWYLYVGSRKINTSQTSSTQCLGLHINNIQQFFSLYMKMVSVQEKDKPISKSSRQEFFLSSVTWVIVTYKARHRG